MNRKITGGYVLFVGVFSLILAFVLAGMSPVESETDMGLTEWLIVGLTVGCLILVLNGLKWIRGAKINKKGNTVGRLRHYIVSLLVMILDRVAMYWTGRRGRLSIAAFGLWNLAEILCIAVIYACFTALYCLVDEDSGSMRWLRVFLGSCVFGLVGLGVPALVSSLIMTVVKKDNIVRLTDFSNIVTDSPEKPYEDKRITLFDGNGVLKISINEDNLYFIESDDNYIKVWYTDSESKLQNYFLRCRLKTVEESFMGSSLVRCHRKYIVNIDKVKALSKGTGGYTIIMNNPHIPQLPVSKTYEQAVLDRCSVN